MKQIRYLFGGLLFLFASIGSVTAQEVSDYSKLQPSDYSSITLPPLDLLFENAKSAPTYELATVKEQIERKLLAKEKRAFLGFFSLRGSYQYGMFGNEVYLYRCSNCTLPDLCNTGTERIYSRCRSQHSFGRSL